MCSNFYVLFLLLLLLFGVFKWSNIARHTAEPVCWRGDVERKERQPLLLGWIRPKVNVALLCQTCQESKMDSYQGRSCTGQGWRGGAKSRLTAAINHVHHQPDAGCRGGGCWRERPSELSFPEMSFCQLVPSGLTCVINPSHHLSIKFLFQGQVCLWHAPFSSSITKQRWRLVDIFWKPAECIHLRKTASKCPSNSEFAKRQVVVLIQDERWKVYHNISDIFSKGLLNLKLEWKFQWIKKDKWTEGRPSETAISQVRPVQGCWWTRRISGCVSEEFPWWKPTDAEQSRQPELTFSDNRSIQWS